MEIEPAAAELVERAKSLRSRLIEHQAETETLTRYSPELHEEFKQAGFYRMLAPKRFGGLELDVPTFLRVVIELARGCPSTGWMVCLASAHVLQLASWFDEAAQEEIFSGGQVLCPSQGAPTGVARPSGAGGWEISARYAYCSGAPYATHFLGQAIIDADDERAGSTLLFVAPRSEWVMLDDWGNTLGLRGSGSNSIVFESGHVPAHFAIENASMMDFNVTGGTPGYRLHGNAMYAGRAAGFFSLEIAALMIGMGLGALDEYREILQTRTTIRPPIVPRAEDPDYLRAFGRAKGRLEAAAGLANYSARQFMDACYDNVQDDSPFTLGKDHRIGWLARESMWLAWSAMVDYIFRTAGSGAAHRGQRMERIYRDMSTGWGHLNNSTLVDWLALELARDALSSD